MLISPDTSRIIGVTDQPISDFYRYFPYSQILQTEGFALCQIEDLDATLTNTVVLTCETYESGFLNRIHVKEDATYGHHSLANEWGLMALNRFVSKDPNRISEILRKAEMNLFFRYSIIKNLDIRDVLEDTSDNDKKDTNLIPKQEKQKGGKYLLIDDKGNEGWKEVLKCCVRDVEAFDVHDKETASYNALPKAIRDKLKEGYYDVIFLDLRLMACEENKDLNVMEFSGMKVLQGIKQANPGNQVIDALLNTKYSIAKENGIQFLLKIFIPEELPVNQCDLGVVLGNALDNAIEATEKCTGNDKDIEIAMGIKKQSLVLVIKNPYEGYLKQDKIGKLISTKNDFRRHGYGISSIQKVADKYGGDVIIETQDGKFVLTVMMNIGDF